jgi:hypothetical protein
MKKSTDTINAKLTPKEAVLNRNAAELLGRDAIKRLNAHGNRLAKRGVDLASDPTPGPSTENLLGYQYGTEDVRNSPVLTGYHWFAGTGGVSGGNNAWSRNYWSDNTVTRDRAGSQYATPVIGLPRSAQPAISGPPTTQQAQQSLLDSATANAKMYGGGGILPSWNSPTGKDIDLSGYGPKGYQYGTAMVGRDDRGDLMREADNTFYGGGQPAPTPTPTPTTRMYQYGTEDVRRRRTTDRYYRGININARPSRNAINDTGQGEIITGSGGGGGYGIGRGQLPPDQNPAYQAALSRGRVNRNDMTTVYLPSGGTMRVPNKSLGGTLAAIKGSTIQPKQAYSEDYAKGFGAPAPYVTGVGAPGQKYLKSGGVYNPIENLTSQQRVQYGVGGAMDNFRNNPTALAIGSRLATNNQYASNLGSGFPSLSQFGKVLGGAASRIAGLFGGNYNPREANQASNFGTPGNFGLAPNISAPAGINNLVPPPPLVGRSPNEQMFPTGAGGSTFFPSAQPGLGTVQMANEQSPGNMALSQDSQYPTPIQQNEFQTPIPQYAQQPRRYSDLY